MLTFNYETRKEKYIWGNQFPLKVTVSDFTVSITYHCKNLKSYDVDLSNFKSKYVITLHVRYNNIKDTCFLSYSIVSIFVLTYYKQ